MRLFTLTTRFLVLSLGFFTVTARADPGSITSFAVMRNGEQIGTNTIQLQRNGAETIVRIVTHVQVKIALVTLYRFDQVETERWIDGHLLAMDSVTDDNGTAHRVTASGSGNKITVEADGKTAEVPGTTIPASLWNPALLNHTRVLNLQDGTVMPIAIVDRGEEHLVVRGDERRAHHYSITGTFQQDVWYDDQRQLIKVELKGRDGSIIQYQPG